MRATVDAVQVEELLSAHLIALGLRLPSQAFTQFAGYANHLDRWNQRINLTGASDAVTIVREHVADALYVVPHLPAGPSSLLDVGSGAGLPGIPIAIARPDLAVLLIEPVGKKEAFLRATRRELRLDGIEVRGCRLEHLAVDERFDVAVSRAVWDPLTWLDRSSPWVVSGGRTIALAGAEAGPPPPGVGIHRYQLGQSSRELWIKLRA